MKKINSYELNHSKNISDREPKGISIRILHKKNLVTFIACLIDFFYLHDLNSTNGYKGLMIYFKVKSTIACNSETKNIYINKNCI